MVVLDVGTDAHEQIRGGLEVFRLLAVGIEAEVDEYRVDDLRRSIKQGDAAALQLRRIFRVEHQRPGVHRHVGTQRRLYLGDVVTEARRTPQPGHRVLVTRVVQTDDLHHLGIEVLPIRQLGLVELAEHTGLDLALEERGRRHNEVIAGAASEELAFQHLVVVEHVVLDLDARALLEVRERVLCDVVRPVVDVQHLFFGRGGSRRGTSLLLSAATGGQNQRDGRGEPRTVGKGLGHEERLRQRGNTTFITQ